MSKPLNEPKALAPEVEDKPTAENNVANDARALEELRRNRVPFSTHKRKLQVRPIPGYYLYWFREGSVDAAKAAGYELVDKKEVYINNVSGYGSPQSAGGNTDLGNQVSIVTDRMSGERAVLMKLRMELHLEDQAEDDKFDAQILSGIFSGEMIASPHESGESGADLKPSDGSTYSRSAGSMPGLFQRPARKIRLMGGQTPNPVGLNARMP
jgi:hypothetical protein